MARPIWTGSLSFGLVNVGIGLYAATESRGVSFHQFEQESGRRVRNKRVAEGTDRAVPLSDIVKGYETRSGEHVIINQEELGSVQPETSSTITINDFVDVTEIDPIYFDRAYYLGPRGDGDEHPYALLREAMRQAGLAGIAKLVMRNKEHLAAVRATEEALVLNTMYFADEVRQPRQAIDRLPSERSLPERELNTAMDLIRQLTTEWAPEQYHDTYREQVLELIERKASGGKVEVEPRQEPNDNVVDLMSALEQSIERAQQDRTTGSEVKRTRGAGRRRSTRKEHSDLTGLTKKQLYDRAGHLGVSGRSKMSRGELEHAVAKAS